MRPLGPGNIETTFLWVGKLSAYPGVHLRWTLMHHMRLLCVSRIALTTFPNGNGKVWLCKDTLGCTFACECLRTIFGYCDQGVVSVKYP